jgi:hypothetical protein
MVATHADAACVSRWSPNGGDKRRFGSGSADQRGGEARRPNTTIKGRGGQLNKRSSIRPMTPEEITAAFDEMDAANAVVTDPEARHALNLIAAFFRRIQEGETTEEVPSDSAS